jgi:hypothetical protein
VPPWGERRGPGDVEPTRPGDAEQPLSEHPVTREPEPTADRPATPQFGGAAFREEHGVADVAGDGYVSARPLLMVGAFGPVVSELAHALADAGYANKVAAGRSQPLLDDELMRVVQQFQDDNEIAPHRPQGEAAPLVPGRDRHSGVVEAATWDALGLTEHVDANRYPAGSFA